LTSKRGDALLLGAATGAAAAVVAYAAVRGAERALFLEPNPAMLIGSDRSPFAWRSAIALYLGGAAVFGGYALAVRSPPAAARAMLALVAAAVAAILVQGALLP
jgi:hypothetical protein